MKKITKFIPVVLVVLLALPILASAQHIVPPTSPTGGGLTADDVEDFITNVANFIMTIGVILAIIAVVVGGIMFATAGGNEDRATKGKLWLKNGLIAAAIIFAAGLLVDTVANIVAQQFF